MAGSGVPMESSERSVGMTRKPFAKHARVSEGVGGQISGAFRAETVTT
jgi:hypothetical protein